MASKANPINRVIAAPALALLLATAGAGCARVNAVWDAVTKPLPANPDEPKPAAVAQGEEAPSVPAPASQTERAAAPMPTPAKPVPVEFPPPPIPVVNMFGELDGRQPVSTGEGAEYAFQQHTTSDEGYDADVTVDPTGKWLAFTSTRHSEKSDIYLQRVDGTSVTQLTSDTADDAQPSFSPDGRTIAFCSTRSGSWDIYTMDIDGRNVTQVTSGPSQDMHPSFSPDGKRLAYCSIGGRSGQWEIWVVDLTTHEKRMIGYGLFPTWCPDKSKDRIAFQRARQRGSRWFSLWTLDLVEGEARRMTEVAVSSNAAIVSPSWSPDGKRLAFSTVVEPVSAPGDRNKSRPNKGRGQQDVWIVDADGGNRHRVTDGSGAQLSPWWASDGRVYFISDRGGHENVWSARVDGPGGGPWPVAGGAKNSGTVRKGTGVDSKGAVGSSDPSEVAK